MSQKVEQPHRDEPGLPRPPYSRYRAKRFFGSSHWWATERLLVLPRTVAVLDVGSGSGEIGRALQARGFTELYAVEVDAASVTATRSYYKRIEESIDHFRGCTFDVVVLLDVLEHVEHPRALLADAASLLRPGGSVLISVPNIGHWSARLLMMFGVFRFADRGILDPTHRHFFTRQRILELLESSPHLAIEEFSSSISPIELVVPQALHTVRPFQWLTAIRWRLAQRFPEIGAYQHLVRLSIRAPTAS